MRKNLIIIIIVICYSLGAFYFWFQRPVDFSSIEAFEFPAGSGKTDVEKTLSSLSKVKGADRLYLMTYYGDYQERLEEYSRTVLDLSQKGETKWKCSLISLAGDKNKPIYGRNFDFADNGILVTQFRPPNKYSSITLSPTTEMGLPKDFEPEGLSADAKEKALRALFFSTCGMNEKGVVTALASTAAAPTKEAEGLKYVFVTQWIREILDNAKNVEEAVNICKRLKVFDSKDTIQHHILIADKW